MSSNILMCLLPIILPVAGFTLYVWWIWIQHWSVALLLWLTGRETEAKLIDIEQRKEGKGEHFYVIYQYFADDPQHGLIAYEAEQMIKRKNTYWLDTIAYLTIRYVPTNPSFSRLSGEYQDGLARFSFTFGAVFLTLLVDGFYQFMPLPPMPFYPIVWPVMFVVNMLLIYFGLIRAPRRKKRQPN